MPIERSEMKKFLVIICALLALALPSQAEPAHQHHGHKHHGHNHQLQRVHHNHKGVVFSKSGVARASTYIATCSQGDLNQRFRSRAAALKAARAHSRSTGHRTGVVKQ